MEPNRANADKTIRQFTNEARAQTDAAEPYVAPWGQWVLTAIRSLAEAINGTQSMVTDLAEEVKILDTAINRVESREAQSAEADKIHAGRINTLSKRLEDVSGDVDKMWGAMQLQTSQTLSNTQRLHKLEAAEAANDAECDKKPAYVESDFAEVDEDTPTAEQKAAMQRHEAIEGIKSYLRAQVVISITGNARTLAYAELAMTELGRPGAVGCLLDNDMIDGRLRICNPGGFATVCDVPIPSAPQRAATS